ncbi:YrhB domain-containing protein [Streptomyces sp. NPDC048419]|uniref:YrhB domain-containing protein n=1 Tax=Streptomyces sp. NPDC048419 TaxID=3365547 RepID=UPI0037118778
MIERDAAVRIVEEELDREHQKWAAAGVDRTRARVVRVEEHELVWIVHWQSEEFARTGDLGAMLVGTGPYLVDRVDGGLHEIGGLSARSGEWQDDYCVRVRGLTVRTTADDLHDEICEVAAVHGHLAAVRTLRRRLPVLAPTHALEYVRALVEGEAPAHLAAIAVERLVEPVDPVFAVRTIRQGKPSRPN